jgi:hypothetical protein
MATAIQIINRAMRLCRILDANEAAEAQDASDSLETLNALLAEMYEANIGLPDYSFANLTDTLATDNADREAIAFQLAIRIAPEYGVQLGGDVMALAEQTMGRMRLRYLQPGTIDLTELPYPTLGRWGFNVSTGDY